MHPRKPIHARSSLQPSWSCVDRAIEPPKTTAIVLYEAPQESVWSLLLRARRELGQTWALIIRMLYFRHSAS